GKSSHPYTSGQFSMGARYLYQACAHTYTSGRLLCVLTQGDSSSVLLASIPDKLTIILLKAYT
ncbi:MAG: hypothetical protein ACOYEI_07310, partial [Acetivibrionales bacterium]